MSLLKTIEDLTKGAATTAYSVARHPVTTVAVTVGFVKGTAEAGVGLVRSVVTGQASQPESETTGPPPVVTPEDVPEPEVAVEETIEPDLPGPDIVLAAVPNPDDLPEPVVIVADDTPVDPGLDQFHHEPHATTRADTIGQQAGDVFEAEDEAEEALEELHQPQS